MPNNIDDIEFRSEDVQEILTKVPHWMIRWGNVLFLSLVLLLLFISWFVKYPDIISGNGSLTTINPPQKEYARISGKITNLLVKDNDVVSNNTSLAILENTANYKDVFFLKKIIDTITVNNKDFIFPLDSIPILFLGNIDTNYALFENDYIQYRLNKELKPFKFQADASSKTKIELNSRLKTLLSQKSIYASEMSFKEKDLERYRKLYEKGVVSAQEYENKQLDFLQNQRNFKNIKASISLIREQINSNRNISIGDQINNTREEIRLLKNVIQSFNQLKNSIRDWEMLFTFQSKIEGKVSFFNYWSENQTVNNGDLVFTIVPDDHKGYVVKTKIPALNSGKVIVNQKVNIKLQNYPEAEFGVLHGSVKSISSIPDNEGFYSVDVILPERLITSYQKEIKFKQEMICTAEIITEDLRLIERFFYQFRETIKRN